jgi:hypothetical protein
MESTARQTPVGWSLGRLIARYCRYPIGLGQVLCPKLPSGCRRIFEIIRAGQQVVGRRRECGSGCRRKLRSPVQERLDASGIHSQRERRSAKTHQPNSAKTWSHLRLHQLEIIKPHYQGDEASTPQVPTHNPESAP